MILPYHRGIREAIQLMQRMKEMRKNRHRSPMPPFLRKATIKDVKIGNVFFYPFPNEEYKIVARVLEQGDYYNAFISADWDVCGLNNAMVQDHAPDNYKELPIKERHPPKPKCKSLDLKLMKPGAILTHLRKKKSAIIGWKKRK